MVEDIKRLHEEKVSLTKQLELVQSEMENHSCMNGVSDDSNQEIITRLEKEKKELQEELNKYNKNSVVNYFLTKCIAKTFKNVILFMTFQIHSTSVQCLYVLNKNWIINSILWVKKHCSL